MRAIDTNIIVRLLTADDPQQATAARQIMLAGDFFVGVTVLLETEWVLRAGYGFAGAQIAAALRGLAGLPGVSVEAPEHVATALDWLESGIDFADALHLVRAGDCTEFITFDRKFAKRAQAVSGLRVTTP